MVHVIWSGKGYLVAVFTFGFSLVANLITNYLTGNGAYWDAHKWPLAISLFFSSAVCWLLGVDLDRREARVLLDPITGEQVVLKQSNTLFFIPMRWWGPILAIGSVAVLITEILKRG
jgi:hypothetical protein